MSKVYIVAYDENSKYADSLGQWYDYKSTLPNAKRIKKGDVFLLYSTSKSRGDSGIFAVAIIEDIAVSMVNGIAYKTAIFKSYKELNLVSIKSADGIDYRLNIQHSMSSVKCELLPELLIKVLKNGK